jgi:hypothetical protein
VVLNPVTVDDSSLKVHKTKPFNACLDTEGVICDAFLLG